MSLIDEYPLLVTQGEPAGIGPDLCVQLAQTRRDHPVVVVGSTQVLKQRAVILGLPLSISLYHQGGSISRSAGNLTVLESPLVVEVKPAQLNPANAPHVLRSLDIAIDLCVKGKAPAMVTCPLHKGVINQAGISFTGHTEYLAHRTGGYPVMMLAIPDLRVALATTHLPLREVPSTITRESLQRCIEVLWTSLKSEFHIANPRILVCGLNPHAGEQGHLGREEIETIEPVICEMSAAGMDLVGPLPADTAFTQKWIAQGDAILAMYHDQGLAVLKHKGFGQAANITLGLPIIRTSVDHGTALDLVGTGNAGLGSLIYALDVAAHMAGLAPEPSYLSKM